MATSTLVITYTVAAGVNAGDAGEIVTSMTVDGTADASLTQALVQKAVRTMDAAQKYIVSNKQGTLTGDAAGENVSRRGFTKQTT